MKITSKEAWNDGTPITWEVSVKEIPLDEQTLDESYDRDCEPNRDMIAQGAKLRAFVVEAIDASPDEHRSDDEDEPIAGCEFSQVKVGDKLVVIMNHKEFVEKKYGRKVSDDFSTWPTLLNLQDCGFNIEVVGN